MLMQLLVYEPTVVLFVLTSISLVMSKALRPNRLGNWVLSFERRRHLGVLAMRRKT